MIPVLQAIALLCLLFAAVEFALANGQSVDDLGVAALVVLVIAVLAAGAWVLRGIVLARHRRRGEAAARPWIPAVISVAVSIVMLPLMDIAFGYATPVLTIAIMLLVIDVRPLAAVIYIAVTFLLAMTVHMVWPLEGGVLDGLVIGLFNSVPVALMNTLGIALGMALLAYRTRLQQARTLLEQRDAALAELRRQQEVEKELVLSQERSRAAHELHDGLGHRLTLIGMSLEFAARMRERDPQRAWEEADRAQETAREALEEMRLWVRALSPARADDAQGLAVLESIAESFRGTGMQVEVDVTSPEDPALTQEQALLVYRAVQEGLTNAVRHARARRVLITARPASVAGGAEGRGISLQLRNDVAADPALDGAISPEQAGFGLRGLHERAEALGGTLEAHRAGDTFDLTLTLPLTDAAAGGGSGEVRDEDPSLSPAPLPAQTQEDA